jgi:hypothetical protein
MGYEQSRRDDIESVIYMLIHFLRGDLPWTVGNGNEQQRNRVKATASIETMCAGLPPEFAHVLRQVRLLKFEQRPEYEAYREIFQKMAAEEPFDWERSGLLASLEGDARGARARKLSCPAQLPLLRARPGSGSGAGTMRRFGSGKRSPARLMEPAVRLAPIGHKAMLPDHSAPHSGGQRK